MNSSLTFLTLASFAALPASIICRLAALPLPLWASPVHALTGFIAVATASIVLADYSRARGTRLQQRDSETTSRNARAAHALAA
jgi:hypothetical protein